MYDLIDDVCFLASKKSMAKKTLRLQRGVIIPLTAIMIATLLSFGALAIDLGYLMVARNQIQNAADAAALNGTRYLYPLVGTPRIPNWTSAETEATNAIALNKVAGSALSVGTVVSGYWNITGSPPTGLQAKTITPGINDLPAVKVTINKADNGNGGPIGTFFAKVFGVNTMNTSATAVAVISSPSIVNNNLFPITISECMYNSYWNSVQNQPIAINDPRFILAPYSDPYLFAIGDAYHYPGCGATTMAGQWTSFTTDSNSTTTIRDLIDYATGVRTPPANFNGSNVGIGTDIWVQSGVRDTLYSNGNQPSVDSCSQNLNNSWDKSGDGTCAFVLIAVICPGSPTCAGVDTATHSALPVTVFACLNIIKAIGGAPDQDLKDADPTNYNNYNNVVIGKLVSAETHPQCKIFGTGGGAPNAGVTLPPKLANYWRNTY